MYIFVPIDMIDTPLSSSTLDIPVQLTPPIDEEAEENAVSAMLAAFYVSRHPVLIADMLVARLGAINTVRDLAEKLKIPTFSTPMGKSIIDEEKHYYHGVYAAKISAKGIREAVEWESDLVIDVGPWGGDMNTAYFSREIDESKHIRIELDRVTIKGETFPIAFHSCQLLTTHSGTFLTLR